MTPRKPEEDLTSDATEPDAEAKDIGALQQALSEEKTKADANLAGWQRAQADFINYKRRAEQEKEETGRLANSLLVLNLLPILNDLERALTAIPDDLAELSWVDGISLIDRKFRTTLETHGLSTIKALGEPFDPNLHEAMMQGEGEEGMVIKELEKGYKFRDKVLRPAKVVVGNGEEKKEE